MKICFALSAFAVLLLACCTTFVNGQTDGGVGPKELSEYLVKTHVAWKTKASSPGASVEAKETGRQGGIVTYNLYVKGLPSEKLYTAVGWPVTQSKPTSLMDGLSIGKGGIVMCRTPKSGAPLSKDDIADFTFHPVKGEPYRIALVA
jgi:hypothetical protein